MGSSDIGSAIDDSFDPTIFRVLPASGGSVRGSDGQYNLNGPRSGHWTVKSSVGSAIDDRCPTVWDARAETQGAAQSHAHAKPIAGSLLRKLGKASLEKQAALDAQRTVQEAVRAPISERGHGSTTASTPKQDAKPKGFYVPRLKDGGGDKVATQGGQKQVIKGGGLQPDSKKR